ncbi:hypothetical protein BC940DRAFT_275514 [Gongronella butleri]|nr:hypothetical protein BC940DRAFT_275514 [Gongronella butleri]
MSLASHQAAPPSMLKQQVVQPPTNLADILVELVTKRVSTIQYLSRTHQGNTHWFNTILLAKDDLRDMYPNAKMMKRSCHFYTLGLSLGHVLDIHTPIDFVKALAQLLSEFDAHTNDTSRQKMKNIFRKTKNKDDAGYDVGDYVYLTVPHIPHELDYFEVLFTLCDVLIETYHKFISQPDQQCTQPYFELVLKCDGKFKKLFAMMTKELDMLARNAIKDELKLIDPLSFSNKMTPIDFDPHD